MGPNNTNTENTENQEAEVGCAGFVHGALRDSIMENVQEWTAEFNEGIFITTLISSVHVDFYDLAFSQEQFDAACACLVDGGQIIQADDFFTLGENAQRNPEHEAALKALGLGDEQ